MNRGFSLWAELLSELLHWVDNMALEARLDSIFETHTQFSECSDWVDRVLIMLDLILERRVLRACMVWYLQKRMRWRKQENGLDKQRRSICCCPCGIVNERR